MEKITSTAARKKFTEYLNRIVYRDESFIIEKGGKKVAKLVPYKESKEKPDAPAEYPLKTVLPEARWRKS